MRKSTKPVKPPVTSVQKFWHNPARPFAGLARNNIFRRCYAVFALLVLVGTTLLWAVLGARLQGRNADQLSDPYMFSTAKIFHGALFPGSHTFLIKWPIFWLLNVMGISQRNLIIATVSVVLVTVLALAYVLYRIDRRPLVFGTICLSLSLALLLVPAQPYAGGLLPVNMAMLTTRNIEYIVYLAALVFLARAKRVKSWNFAAGCALLVLLIASDKLFLSLSLGGALLALVVYSGLKAWKLVTFAVHWLVGSAVAAAGSAALLAVLSATRVTHLVSSNAATPYKVAAGAKDLALGVLYGMLGLFTNVGANPAYDGTTVRQLPGILEHRLLSVGGPAYIAAALALLYALVLAWWLAWRAPRTKPRATPTVASLLALGLIWSTVAAFGVFVASHHYYAVDARYLTIGLFALVVTVSVEFRKHRWQHPEVLILVACCLLIAITLAVGTSLRVSRTQTAALDGINGRNAVITEALQRHKVDILVGNYWRVLPVKLAMHGAITATPLAGCTQPTGSLTSSAWQPNLRNHSFAYLLTISGSIANFPDCSVSTIAATYGRPNAMQVISGTAAHPTEALLFYDQGSRPPVPAKESVAPVSILPVTLDSVADTDCMVPTIMNVVAHEDDDLLFLSPDLLHEIHGGDCIRTVFLTAGDDGQDKLYWLSRQLGAEAAYDNMLGGKHVWVQQTVEMAPGEFVTMASPRGVSRITLIFFNLPDGNLQGQGFPSSGFESLAKLKAGAVTKLRTVDGQSTYTSGQLTAALTQLMHTYHPAELHSQADVKDAQYPDHSDHTTTGKYAQDAAVIYDHQQFGDAVALPVKLYIGYPIHGYGANVSDGDLAQKETAFFAYSGYDSVCHSVEECQHATYGFYLARQYQHN